MSAVISANKFTLVPISVDDARAQGYQCLNPIERAVAIEFATTGHTLRQVAQDLGHPISEVRKAFGSPLVRALIADIQNEVAQHKIINAAWVEQQVMEQWPKFIGEEEINTINKSGEEVTARKFHGPEVASILKHFSGNGDQKKAGGVQVQINFGDLGVGPSPAPAVRVIEQ